MTDLERYLEYFYASLLLHQWQHADHWLRLAARRIERAESEGP